MPLRNDDMQDRELLFAVDECSDHDGMTSREDLQDYLQEPMRAVANRLSWMRQYGYLERVDPKEHNKDRHPRYIITGKGQQLMGGRITASVEKELERDPGTQLLIMRELSRRAYVDADFTTSSAIRREWQANANRRSR